MIPDLVFVFTPIGIEMRDAWSQNAGLTGRRILFGIPFSWASSPGFHIAAFQAAIRSGPKAAIGRVEKEAVRMGTTRSDRIGAEGPLWGILKTLSASPHRVVSKSGSVSMRGSLNEAVCAFATRHNKIRAEGPLCNSSA